MWRERGNCALQTLLLKQRSRVTIVLPPEKRGQTQPILVLPFPHISSGKSSTLRKFASVGAPASCHANSGTTNLSINRPWAMGTNKSAGTCRITSSKPFPCLRLPLPMSEADTLKKRKLVRLSPYGHATPSRIPQARARSTKPNENVAARVAAVRPEP